jgi:hypothetical protein
MNKLYFLLGLALSCFQGHAQVIYGANNYTQYHQGNLPIVISVPHGGLVTPASIPDRTCNNPTIDLDSRTIELARQIDTAFFNLTGCRPHLIICNLRRTKIDCNRNIADGACGNSQAETAWTEFQHFIDTAQFLAKSKYSGKAFYFDLHGHGKPILRLELGYGLTGAMLNTTNSVLNTPTYIAASSLKNLVSTNVSGSTHAQLIRGPNSLGTMFENAGFPSVPSQLTPNPDTNAYFSGGYNTFNHTCLASGNTVNGLQIECDTTVRFGYLNRKKFADSLATILIRYMSIHQNLNLLTNCGLTTSIIENKENATISFEIFPNPATHFIQLTTDQLKSNYEVVVINVFGEIVFRAPNQNKLDISHLPKGIYFVQVTHQQKRICNRKMIIQ